MFSFTNVIHIIIIFQGALLTLYILVSNPKKSKRDFFLALIIGTMALQVLGLFLANRGIAQHFFQGINCAYGFLYGPLLLFYNRFITQRNFTLRAVHMLHLLPFVAMCLGILVTGGSICRSQIYIAYVAHILICVCLCFLEVRKYKRVIKDNYSRLEWLNLGWLHWVFVIFCLIVFVDITQFVAFLIGFDTYALENTVFILMPHSYQPLVFLRIYHFKKPLRLQQGGLGFFGFANHP